VILLTGDAALQGRLEEEKLRLRSDTYAVTEETFGEPGRFGDKAFDAEGARRGFFISAAARLCKGFL